MAAIASTQRAQKPSPSCPSATIQFTEIAEQRLPLHMDLPQTVFEVSLAAGTVPDTKQQSEQLREQCRQVARKACGELRSLIAKPAFAELDISEFRSTLEELERLLDRLEGIDGPQILPIGANSPSASPSPAAGLEALTPREIEVLRLIAGGQSTKEVASTLGMSFKTAACHRYRIMDKLGIHDAVTLTHYAVRNGLVKV
jgi:DNA-binding CsgD family transcriptional regulator